MSCKITQHGQQRIRQRVGIPKKAVHRIATKALNEGISWRDIRGGLRHYMNELYQYGNGEANNIRLYKDFIYLFHNHILITVYNVPGEYRKQALGLQKRRKDNGLQ